MSKPAEQHSEGDFYREQLGAQRGMLSSAIAALTEKKASLEKTVLKLENRKNEITQITYHLFHSFRGPLTTLLGILDLMNEEEVNPEQAYLVKEAQNAINKLDNFAINLAKYMELLVTRHDPKDLSVGDLLLDSIKRVNKEVSLENIQIVTANNGNDLRKRVCVEAEVASAVLQIGLKNAAMAFDNNTQRPKISLHAKPKGDRVIFVLEDNGIGMSETVKARAKEMFYKGQNDPTRQGLGLYIASILLEERGGTMKVMSREGQGTILSFALPVNGA